MNYLTDPWIWFTPIAAIVFAIGAGRTLGRIVEVAATTEQQGHRAQGKAIRLAGNLLLISTLGFVVKCFQWGFGGLGQPYVGIFVITAGFIGTPLAFDAFIRIRHQRQPGWERLRARAPRWLAQLMVDTSGWPLPPPD